MAKFIGSKLQDDNWGEDYFIKKLMEYFDDSYVIYRNRPIFGAQFDVCLLVPKIGVIIFEVKGWKANTIKRVENGDAIIIETENEDTHALEESRENPTNQARGYVYKMRRKIRQKTGKNPLVFDMVCFPNLSREEYDIKGIEPVCEYETTILRDDLVSKAALYNKLNLAMKNHMGTLKHGSEFSPELMFRVRQIFETDIKLEDLSVENTDLVDGCEQPNKVAYSICAYVRHDDSVDSVIKTLSSEYAKGTKLYIAVEDKSDLDKIQKSIDHVITEKGLLADGLDLKINFEEKSGWSKVIKDTYMVFNCAAYLIPVYDQQMPGFLIKDGKIDNSSQKEILEFIDANSNFNIDQFYVEHSDITKNAIVRAGAGTGKTFTMISRIAFICHMQNCAMKEMANRIVMITFTDDAANQMEEKIKQHFNNYYLLTGDTDCLSFINQIEGMQISTIHSYAKKIISQLGFEFGYGVDLSVTSGDYKRKQIIADRVDKYIIANKKKYGNAYIKDLGIPVYLINKHILNMLTRLHNQSIDISALTKSNFGKPILGNGTLHDLIATVVPEIEKEYDEYLRKENKLHLNNMMSMLEACIGNEENRRRLIKMQAGRPQFMFVDEFQDTDDVQIEALTKIAELLQYKLFVVGDVKQCIYRFRGAKENAFDQLNFEGNPNWLTFSLSKNYRTDSKLLDLFHNSFDAMGREQVGDENLLIYRDDDNRGDRLIGTKKYNDGQDISSFYKKVTITDEDSRIPALFEEVRRQIEIINSLKASGKKLSKKECEIAILVRENWQAELIKQTGKQLSLEFDIITNTGGDLYMSDPALDMLTLANALLHYDEADYLYALVSSNFVGGGMSKARMYSIRQGEKKTGWKKTKSTDTSQSKELQMMLNRELSSSEGEKWKDWNSVIRSLRTVPVLQVMRKLYHILKPWVKYAADNKEKQDYYRLNVDLLFEELVNSANMDSLTINSLVDILIANIVSQKNVDSRLPETRDDEIVVRCVTVHKSKGLEYGSVILPYCSSPINIMKRTDMNVSVVNHGMIEVGYQIKVASDTENETYQNDFFDESMEKNERMREEARILYVAMTRAIRSFSWISFEGKKNKCWQNLVWEEK